MFEQIHAIWRCLQKHNVKYITIGGFAVSIYGYNRNTGDLDIYIEDSPENRKQLRKALNCANVGDFEQIETMQFIPGWTDFTLDYGLRLDIMTQVKGLETISFDDLLQVATVLEIEDFSVYFVNYMHLLQSKQAANRLKDQLDIEELKKINPED